MNEIHPTAVIDKNAELIGDVAVGPGAVIEAKVKIGSGTKIGAHAVLATGTTIGKNCHIFPGAAIGSVPQDLKFSGEETFVVIGDNTTIREYATVNRATDHSYYTRIGDNCLLMAYSHVAHDCQLGNNVILANSVAMGGHVVIGNYVGIGGLTAIHQFVHIGEHAFIGGMLPITKDVPPFILAMGNPPNFGGLNAVGLKRRGFNEETLVQLKRAFKIVYRENLTTKESIEKIENNFEKSPAIESLLSFLQKSHSERDRGIIRG